MKHIRAFILTLAASPFLFANGVEENIVSMAFLGIEGKKEPEFSKTLEKKLYEQISILPDIQLVPKEKVDHLREMGKLKSSFPEIAKADFIAEEVMNCRTVLYGQIKKFDISLHRYWFFPLYGRYIGTLELQLLLYDRNDKKYRYEDKISLTSSSTPGFCGFAHKEQYMPLYVETKLQLQTELIQSAQNSLKRSLELSVAGLLPKKTLSAESADSAIVPSSDSTQAAVADTTAQKSQTSPAKTEKGTESKNAPAGGSVPDTSKKAENKATKTQTGK